MPLLGQGMPGVFGRPDNKTLEDRFPIMENVHRLFGNDPTSHIPSGGAPGAGVPGLTNAVFGGADDPRLTPEQNAMLKQRALQNAAGRVTQAQQGGIQEMQSLRPILPDERQQGPRQPIRLPGNQQGKPSWRRALQEAGMAIAMNSGRGHDSLTTPQALAIGLSAYRGSMDRQSLHQLYGEIMDVNGGERSPDALRELLEASLAAGDTETAHEVAYALSVVQQGGGAAGGGYNMQRVEYVTPDDETNIQYGNYDPRQGVILDMQGRPVPGARPAPGGSGEGQVSLQRMTYKDESGTERVGTFNPRTGVINPIEGVSPAGGENLSQDQAKAKSYVGLLPTQMQTLDAFKRAPNVGEFLADELGALGNFALTPEYQRVNIAGLTMADAYLRMTTGAAYSEVELASTRNMLIPMIGDTDEALDYKEYLRKQVYNMVLVRAGQEPIDIGDPPPFEDGPPDNETDEQRRERLKNSAGGGS